MYSANGTLGAPDAASVQRKPCRRSRRSFSSREDEERHAAEGAVAVDAPSAAVASAHWLRCRAVCSSSFMQQPHRS